MRLSRSTRLVCAALALLLGCRDRVRAQDSVLAQARVPVAQPPHDAGAGSGVTVIIQIPTTPIDAPAVDYAAPFYLDPSAAPGTLGNGKPVPRNTAPPPDAALPPP